LLITISTLFATNVFAQTLRGIYVNNFDDILGNTQKEDSLLSYLHENAFNYMALYDLASLDYTNVSEMNKLSAFIRKARQSYGITHVGAVGETKSFFTENIKSYNDSRLDINEKFNVFNVEFEFWITTSVQPGGYYCVKYLQQANCNCDTSGAFGFYINMLKTVDSLAATQGAISETYIGWFNKGQGQQIQSNIDRILLHAYREDNSSVWSYSKTRLSYLAANNQVVNVAPIFSSEPDFMGPWLEDHNQFEAFEKYESDFNNDNSSWKQYIHLLGYHWFNYGFMPKTNPAECVLSIPGGAATDNVNGNSAMLRWNSLSPTDSIIIRYKKESVAGYNYTRLAYTGQESFQLTGLQPGTDYLWSVKTVCGNSSGSYSETKYFTTTSATAIEEAKQFPTDVMIYPNPAKALTHLTVTCSKAQQFSFTLSDITGKAIQNEQGFLAPGKNEFDIDVSAFNKGIYILSLKTKRENILKRISVE
jgi:hypothetical protein